MNQILSIVWDVNPVFFSIGNFDVRYYGFTWALAIGVGLLLFANFSKREGLPNSDAVADSVFWYVAIATIIGSRLGHCLFYEPEYYLTNPIQILNLRQGGMASHGAAIGMLVGLWLFARKNKLPYIWGLDRVAMAASVGGAFVRFGNLINSEIYGNPTDLPWGFVFVRNGETLPMHPTQIYEALCYLLTFGILALMYYKFDQGRRHPGLLFGVGLVGIFLSRFFIEYIKNPQEAFESNMSLYMGQWLSIPFVVLGVVMIGLSFTARFKSYVPQVRPAVYHPKKKTK